MAVLTSILKFLLETVLPAVTSALSANKAAAATNPAPVAAKAKKGVVPAEWMPTATMKRVVLHWTGGAHTVSQLDKEHYHIIVDGKGELHRGKHSITANASIGSKSADRYAAHTKGANSNAIGVSMAAMAGATERPFNAGKFPLTEAQWQGAAEAVADLCKRYSIPVTDRTVLTHAEVQPNLGIKQNGKWDVTRLPFNPSIVGAKACGDDFRRRVKDLI